ncbi:hypothetical protein DPEC_G00348900 [Dallia pectoralis]|uniref:Uncharacterized protein n=1 Tax=Dallia pectoralis TaxID=75939 RepID=A0ACC2F172_DALPE|nr:hypothetical protein DPEC_G00348900 [Dallia pectoralis]
MRYLPSSVGLQQWRPTPYSTGTSRDNPGPGRGSASSDPTANSLRRDHQTASVHVTDARPNPRSQEAPSDSIWKVRRIGKQHMASDANEYKSRTTAITATPCTYLRQTLV